MDAKQLKQVVAAIEALAAEAGGALDKKPNVTDVEPLVGFDVSADERDEAWSAYQEAAADATPDEPPAPKKAATTSVTNAYTSTLSIQGVQIRAGETVDVPRLDREKGVIRRWIEAGVIKVG